MSFWKLFVLSEIDSFWEADLAKKKKNHQHASMSLNSQN